MITQQNLDIRTVTLGLSLRGCADPDIDVDGATRLRARHARRRAARARRRAARARVRHPDRATSASRSRRSPSSPPPAPPRTSRRSPRRSTARRARSASTSSAASRRSCTRASATATARLIASIPAALATTERVCASVNVATTRAGINMDAVAADGARRSRPRRGDRRPRRHRLREARRLRQHGRGQPVHGRRRARRRASPTPSSTSASPARASCAPSSPRCRKDADLTAVAEAIKAHRPSRSRASGELVAREAAKRLGVAMGIVDLSLAPTPAEGDSVAEIIEAMGVERVRRARARPPRSRCSTTPSRRAARWARARIGGLSGAFIPVSEDAGMIRAAECGALTHREARGDDGGVLGGPRHDRDARRHHRRDDRRHHRRRVRDRRHQLQDDRRAAHPRGRQERRRPRGVRRAARRGAGHGGQPVGAARVFARRGGRLPAPLAVAAGTWRDAQRDRRSGAQRV